MLIVVQVVDLLIWRPKLVLSSARFSSESLLLNILFTLNKCFHVDFVLVQCLLLEYIVYHKTIHNFYYFYDSAVIIFLFS